MGRSEICFAYIPKSTELIQFKFWIWIAFIKCFHVIGTKVLLKSVPVMPIKVEGQARLLGHPVPCNSSNS